MKNILVIEDNAGVAELISDRLAENGYKVTIASTGKKALEYLQNLIPDMVILDYSLPDMDGKEIIVSMNKKNQPMPPFIVSTGRGDEQIAVDMMKLGAYDYLIKDKTLITRLPDVVAKLDHEIERDILLSKAQQALRESEERFRNFVEKASDFFVKLNPDGKICYYSPNWQRHLEFDSHEILNKPIFLFIHKDDNQKLQNDIASAIKADNNQFEAQYRIRNKTGEWKIHYVKAYSVVENDEVFINCIARDNTERIMADKRITRAVFEAEEKKKKQFAERLHEDIGPIISAVKMSVGRIKSMKNSDEREVRLIDYSDQLVDDAVAKIRVLANELVPNVIVDFGLVVAFKQLLKKFEEKTMSQSSITLHNQFPEPPIEKSILLYRAIDELLQNSCNTNEPGTVKLDIKLKDTMLLVSFHYSAASDAFRGFDVGFKSIVKNIEALDGHVNSSLKKSSGRISFHLPL